MLVLVVKGLASGDIHGTSCFERHRNEELMKRFLILPAVAVLVAGLAEPAFAQAEDRTEIVSIDPTSGPLGTEIIVTVRNRPGGNADGTARLDFGFNEFTPANTTFFYGDANGDEQTATITAEGGEGKQNPGQTDAYVALSQCKAGQRQRSGQRPAGRGRRLGRGGLRRDRWCDHHLDHHLDHPPVLIDLDPHPSRNAAGYRRDHGHTHRRGLPARRRRPPVGAEP